jgi:hypothetical protein
MTKDTTPEAVERIKGEVMTLEHNGGIWVTAEDYAALSAKLAEAERAKDCFQRMTRADWESLCAMRNSINEYVPMPNTDSGPLFSPENGPIYADIAERVVARLRENQQYILALEEELKSRAEAAEAERDCANENWETALKQAEAWNTRAALAALKEGE